MEYPALFVQMALQAWDLHIKRMNLLLEALTDEEFDREVAPGRNRISYLLGHLVAVNDGMIKILDLGERTYASLDEAFIRSSDRSGLEVPAPATLRSYWKNSCELLAIGFGRLSSEDWFARHTAVSEEDFAVQPTRNKLNVLLNRTNHLAHHLGQMVLAKERVADH